MKAVINLNETTEIKSDLNGNITNSNSFGSISVSNPSKETTLWAISLKGKHGGEVLDFNNQSIQHIQPGKVFEDKYKIQSENKILIKERIDTAVEGTSTDDLNEKRNTLIKGLNQRVLYELTISNNYSFPLKNVELIKTLPDCTEGVDTVPPHPGNIDPTQTPLTWSIDHIDKDSSVTLYLIVDLKPINSKKVETGKIELKANGVGIFSSLDPSIDAECDNVDLSVDVAETQSPGEWNIKVEYTNSSEFATKLETIQVGLPDKVFINEEIQQMIKPKSDGVAWSKTASIKSPDYPEINKNFKYQVDFEVTKSSEITYLKDTNFLSIVEVSAQKKFEPEEVNTYTRTPLHYVVTVKNEGTADISRIQLEETIPPYFLVKSVSCNNSKATITSQINGIDGYDTEIPEDLKSQRKMIVNLTNIMIRPDETLDISFECIAEKPKPNLDYNAPSVAKAFGTQPKQNHVINSLTGSTQPKLDVAYKTRSFKFNANYKAVADNEYEITINIENNGEVPLENVYVNQSIAGGKYSSHTPITISAQDKGDTIEFYINKIKVKETIPIIITVSTSGPIRQTQPSIRVMD